MSCNARCLLYALILVAYVLKNVSADSNSTVTQNVPDNSNITMAPNVPENSNSTMTDNETANTSESYTNTTLKIIQSLTDTKIYNKNLRPYLGEKAVEVQISIWVNDVISVSDYTNDFTVNMYVHQHWYDPRLQFTPINNVSLLILVRDFANLIWLADTHILNSKSLTMQLSDSTLSSARIRIRNDSNVYYKNTFTTTVNCAMDLEYFPVDQQICKLILRSYSYLNVDLGLRWEWNVPVRIKPNISLSTFTLTSYNISKRIGKYNELICNFRLKRILGYYINQIYLPSFMIVLISWIPFWLNRADHYARVGLGVTTVLTITTMVISTNESLPKTSYIKAIDIYLMVCFLMVFLAMVEFAMIGFFESEDQSNTMMETKEVEETVTEKLDLDKVDKLKAPKTKKRNTARIDKVARVFFPTVFITFNLVYVGVLFYISNYFYSHLDKDFINFDYINI